MPLCMHVSGGCLDDRPGLSACFITQVFVLGICGGGGISQTAVTCARLIGLVFARTLVVLCLCCLLLCLCSYVDSFTVCSQCALCFHPVLFFGCICSCLLAML